MLSVKNIYTNRYTYTITNLKNRSETVMKLKFIKIVRLIYRSRSNRKQHYEVYFKRT